jgi:hypothetical protein
LIEPWVGNIVNLAGKLAVKLANVLRIAKGWKPLRSVVKVAEVGKVVGSVVNVGGNVEKLEKAGNFEKMWKHGTVVKMGGTIERLENVGKLG